MRPSDLWSSILPILLAGCASPAVRPAAPAPAAAPIPAAVPAPDPATSASPGFEDPRVREIVSAVSPARVEHDIRTLVGFGTRHTLSDTLSDTRGIGAARRWLFAEFERTSQACGGCLDVRYVSEIVPGEAGSRIPRPVKVVDVVAILRGHADPDRYLIMQGHYDSRRTDVMDSTGFAPGANDDASGVAATLEAARVLSRYSFDKTIVFAALAGEEQGLYGGKALANYAHAQGWIVDGVFNNDIVGNIHGINGVIDNTTVRVFAAGIAPDASEAELRRYLYAGGELDTPSRELGRYTARVAETYIPNLTVHLIYRLDRFRRGGDQTPFFLAGDPAIRVTESVEDYHRQHQNVRTENGEAYGDLPSGVDFPYLAKVTAMNAATLASLAWAPPPPDSVSISGALTPSTTLKWTPVRAPDLAGYRIYWRRPTSPTWDRSRWVGDTTTATLQDIVIDDYFFGVAAVDRLGHESIPVFPNR